MSKNQDIDNELCIYASGIDLAIRLANESGNNEYVIFPQKEMAQLTELIRKKAFGEHAASENIKSLLRDKARMIRMDLKPTTLAQIKTSDIMSLCDLIDEVCG